MKRIFCVGRNATLHRVLVDLNYPSPNLISLVPDRRDRDRLIGYRGPDFWWIDMGADDELRTICEVQRFKQVSVSHARDVLMVEADLRDARNDLLTINKLIFAQGAALGSENYFAIRGIVAHYEKLDKKESAK